MYMHNYIWFMGAIIVCMIFSGIASRKVKAAFTKHDKNMCRSGYTGYGTGSYL